MPIKETLSHAEAKMQKTEEHVQHEFAGVRTGQASPGLVENLPVEAYGSQMRLKELAGITTPETRQLVIQPWDASTLSAIEKAVLKSNLGLNPAIDGKVVRIVIPELSEERRKDLSKVVKKMTEEGRIAIRHVRREAIESLKKESKGGAITEDELAHAEKDIQKLTDKYVGLLDKHLEDKEKEIMTI